MVNSVALLKDVDGLLGVRYPYPKNGRRELVGGDDLENNGSVQAAGGMAEGGGGGRREP